MVKMKMGCLMILFRLSIVLYHFSCSQTHFLLIIAGRNQTLWLEVLQFRYESFHLKYLLLYINMNHHADD